MHVSIYLYPETPTAKHRYNTVGFLNNIHNRWPIASPCGQGMGLLLWLHNLWHVRNIVFNTMRYMTVLHEYLTVQGFAHIGTSTSYCLQRSFQFVTVCMTCIKYISRVLPEFCLFFLEKWQSKTENHYQLLALNNWTVVPLSVEWFVSIKFSGQGHFGMKWLFHLYRTLWHAILNQSPLHCINGSIFHLCQYLFLRSWLTGKLL